METGIDPKNIKSPMDSQAKLNSLETTLESANISYSVLRDGSSIDFCLNPLLFEEYVDKLYKQKENKQVESLFYMFFFELHDLELRKQRPTFGNYSKIIKLKEMISIVLVAGQYHGIVSIILQNPKKYLVQTIDMPRLLECLQFCYKYYKQRFSSKSGSEQHFGLSKIFLLYALLNKNYFTEHNKIENDELMVKIDYLYKQAQIEFDIEQLNDIIKDKCEDIEVHKAQEDQKDKEMDSDDDTQQDNSKRLLTQIEK